MVEFLVERASEDYEPFDFPDEDLMDVSYEEKKSTKRLVGSYTLMGHLMHWGMISMLC